MTAPLKISGLKFAKPSNAGRRQIAFFDIEICGIEIVGCDLIRTASNGLTVRGPIGCTFAESRMHHAVKEAALRAYIALGGDDLPEWARPEVLVISGVSETKAA